MKIFKKFINMSISLALVATMLVPTSITSYAADQPLNLVLEEDFIPFRSSIPSFLSRYSDYKGDVIKKLWAKVFYEESYWNTAKSQREDKYFYDAKYSRWYQKYNHAIDTKTGATIPNYYTALDGSQKQLNHDIVLSTGDFEAYFGNTLEANPEFLGQMLNLPGYEALGKDTDGLAKMREIMVQYLSQPDKYQYMTESIINLTKNGLYIGTKKTDSNNKLRSASYGGLTLDYYVLITIASKYEGDGNETYLSPTQVGWLKSYQEDLYNEYVNSGATAFNGTTWRASGSSLAGRYAPIYDLIARSTYAADGGRKQEFFNYVEASGIGAGAWLNLNRNINIPGLEKYDKIAYIFDGAQGWCGGLHTVKDSSGRYVCGNRSNCTNKATERDKMAYYIYYGNSTAKSFVTNNANINQYIVDHSDASGNIVHGYATNFTAKHSGQGIQGTYAKSVVAGNDIYKRVYGFLEYHPRSDNPNEMDFHIRADTLDGIWYDWTTREIYGEDTLKIDYRAFEAPNQMIVLSVPIPTGWGYYFDADKDGFPQTIDEWHAYVNGVEVSTRGNESVVKATSYTMNGTSYYAFDIKNLTPYQRKNASLSVRFRKREGARQNCRDSGSDACDVKGDVSASGTVIVIGTYPACVQNGHNWVASETNNTITWSSDYTKVMFEPYCSVCGETCNKRYISVKPTDITTEGNFIVYKAYDPYENITVTKRINKTNGQANETIAFNSSNTTGQLSASNVGTDVKRPAGSLSDETYKIADCSLTFSTKAGMLKAGARYVDINDTVLDGQIYNLDIQIRSARGKTLGVNSPVSSQAVGEHNVIYKTYGRAYFDAGVKDTDLIDAVITVRASAINQRWSPKGNPNAYIPDPVASMRFDSVTITY